MSLNLWTFVLTSDPEAQSARTNTHTPSLNTPPRGPLQVSRGSANVCTCCIYSPLHSLNPHSSQSTYLFTFVLLFLAIHPDLKCYFFSFSCYFLPSLLNYIRRSSLCFCFSISAWLQTHPPIPRTCWHTSAVFRKQNNPGNMTGIWKCLISLDGWVSNPQASEQERATERETVEEHCSFCQGQMVRAALVLHTPSACQAMTHIRIHTQLPQLVCAAVVFLFLVTILYSRWNIFAS